MNDEHAREELARWGITEAYFKADRERGLRIIHQELDRLSAAHPGEPVSWPECHPFCGRVPPPKVI